jgi:hypothetical protein
MKIKFPLLAYVWSILIGALLLIFGVNGHIIVVCIACNSVLINIAAGISIVVGLVGIFNSVGPRAVAS